MIARLTIVRHGETVDNVLGVAQGWRDSALSDVGRRQVQRLARRLVSIGVTSVFSSSLPRAMTTARCIASPLGLDVVELPTLREMNYGQWEGMPFMEIRRIEPDVYERWISDPAFPCPDGECFQDVVERMRDAIGSIERSAGGEHPLVVSHGTAIRVIATMLLGMPVQFFRSFMQHNAAINVFERRRDQWLLRVWNDATHLNGVDG